MLRIRATAGWALLLLTVSGLSQATTIPFTATITSTNLTNFANGQVIAGSLTFDSTVAGLPQFDGTRIYTGAITNFELAGLQLRGPQNLNSIRILPFSVSDFNDVFDARIGSATSTLEFYLEADKNTGTLGNGALPAAPFDLAAFQDPSVYRSTYVQFADFTNGYQNLDATITASGPAAVPEPGPFALIALGFAGIWAPAWRRRNTAFIPTSQEQQ